MVKLTKIYTRTGDAGQTHLAGGQRVSKTTARIHAIGDVDELNAWLGKLAVELQNESTLADSLKLCETIQQQLFNLGAELAILANDKRPNSPHITQANIDALEKDMDLMNEQLKPLTSFILPGGNSASTTTHLARTVCRRVERQLFLLAETEPVSALAIAYINRLSDWLFVLARFICLQCQIPETLWTPS